MNALYRVLGISKQGFHQLMDRHLLELEEQQQLLPIIGDIRSDHPRMSCREIYYLLQPRSMGRDRFEQICQQQGFKLERKRSFHRTTNSLGVTRFENLILDYELTGVNQVWVSDITFYRIGEQFYYLTFIMDLYSRLIVGYSVSMNLLTEFTTIPALEMALKARHPQEGLIFHSDGGGQYYSKAFLSITRKHQIKNSMCESVYGNAHAERINGTMKNDYLIPYGPQSFQELEKMTAKAVTMYNTQRPHQALGRMTPEGFEKEVFNKEKRSKKER
jgi:putative transposase